MAVAYGGLLGSVTGSASTLTTTSATLPTGAYAIATWAGSQSAFAPTIADSAGGTWVAIQTPTAGANPQAGYATWIRTTVGTGTAFTVTASIASARSQSLAVTYWTGTNGTYSAVTTGTGTTAYPSVVTSTSNGVGDLFIGVGAGVNTTSTTATASTGFTLAVSQAGTSPSFSCPSVEYQLATGSGQTKTASFTAVTGTTGTRVSTFVLRASSYPNTPFVGWGMRL